MSDGYSSLSGHGTEGRENRTKLQRCCRRLSFLEDALSCSALHEFQVKTLSHFLFNTHLCLSEGGGLFSQAYWPSCLLVFALFPLEAVMPSH